MRMTSVRGLLASLGLWLVATSASATDPAVLLAQIQALPGVVTASQGPSPIPDTLFYRITFRQPLDHADPGGETFTQRVTLLHRDASAPMVLVTDGYATPWVATQQEITAALQTNQLRVEHRFFVGSAPASMDWSKLDIEQSADDLHAVIAAFKALYPARWASTGASKSGMTSVYLRYFHPDDVDATVPYVAPTSQGFYDARYVQFLDRVGDAACRASLRRFQEAALRRRDEVQALVSPTDFGILGLDRSYEFAVIELPFTFWQYRNASFCDAIPADDAPAAEMLGFIDFAVGLDFFADPTLEYYAPYFYQAGTQLGAPRVDLRALGDLLRYPRRDVPENYPPLGVEKIFDGSAMARIRQWVQVSGQRFLFIYGETDPWSTNPYVPSERNDAWRIWVRGAGGNHGANLAKMTPEDREFAMAKLREWLDLPPARFAAPVDAASARVDEPTRAELMLR